MDFVLTFPEQLGLHLKSLRKTAGLSQAELANLLGVSQSRVAAIEKDPAAVSVGQFLAILKLLNAELVIRQGEPTQNRSLTVAERVRSQGLAAEQASRLASCERARQALSTTAADIARSQGLAAEQASRLASYEHARRALSTTVADIARSQSLAAEQASRLTSYERARQALSTTVADIARSQGLAAEQASRLASYEHARRALSTTAADIARSQGQRNATLRPKDLPVDWQSKKPKGSW